MTESAGSPPRKAMSSTKGRIMYAITGATGNTGSRIAERLLEKGEKVRVIGRNLERLKPLADKGAEPFVGSLEDAGAMKSAFAGAKAAYLMVPPNPARADFIGYQTSVARNYARALTENGVKHAVNLSSYGAHLLEGLGVVSGLGRCEQILNETKGVSILHLRPGFFMENNFMSIPTIKSRGVAGGTLKGDIPLPWIATRDVADAAADVLLSLDFEGNSVRELHGPRDLTLENLTRVLGRAIGKEDLQYIQFPYDQVEKAMVEMGATEDVARLYSEMSRGFNEGNVKPTQERSSESTTPTTIEDFAPTFVRAYEAAG
jgi:uncharacterized protein YbjT (DUF2867 family)